MSSSSRLPGSSCSFQVQLCFTLAVFSLPKSQPCGRDVWSKWALVDFRHPIVLRWPGRTAETLLGAVSLHFPMKGYWDTCTVWPMCQGTRAAGWLAGPLPFPPEAACCLRSHILYTPGLKFPLEQTTINVMTIHFCPWSKTDLTQPLPAVLDSVFTYK